MNKARLLSDGRFAFMCLGCDEEHIVPIGGEGWTFNGNLDEPTLSPSVLVRSGHYINSDDDTCWCNFEERTGQTSDFGCVRCHSFVRDGKIQYLDDCSHEYVGRTIALPEYEENKVI